MPLRSVMDDFCFGLLENPFPLSPSQIIHIGGMDFDEVYTILEAADKLAGLGIYEYAPCGRKSPYMEKLIQFGRKL